MADPARKKKEQKASKADIRKTAERKVKADVSESVSAGHESGSIVDLHIGGKQVSVTKEEGHAFGEARTRKQKEAVLKMIEDRSRKSQADIRSDIAKETKARGGIGSVKQDVPTIDPQLAAAAKAFRSKPDDAPKDTPKDADPTGGAKEAAKRRLGAKSKLGDIGKKLKGIKSRWA